MRKLKAAINMTLDGFCNHTAVIADAELHEKVNEMVRDADTMIFGRITYQLMEEGWPPIVAKPTGVKAVDDFALLIDNAEKIVFSQSLKQLNWKNSTLATESLNDTILKLKKQEGKDIMVGSPSLIHQLSQAGLIDEYTLSVQPIILGNGLPLFQNIQQRINLELISTFTLKSGVVMLSYVPKL